MDDDFLYVAAMLYEPHIWATLKNKDDIIYRDNDFEIFIDQDGNGKKYYEIEVNAFNTIMDLFINKPYHIGDSCSLTWNIKSLKSAVKINGTINNPADIDNSWFIEFAIPFSGIYKNNNIRPKINDFWRVNFSRVNRETKIVAGIFIPDFKNKTDLSKAINALLKTELLVLVFSD